MSRQEAQSPETTKALEEGTLHQRGWEQAPRVLAPLLHKGLATLEDFPALSNGVGVLFPLGPLRCNMRKLPQTFEQAVILLFSYEILRRAGSQKC